MFKSGVRIASLAQPFRAIPRAHVARRTITTAPPHKTSRSWRNSAARWGLAGALLYYYNTATVFAEEPTYAVHTPPETSRETETYQTVDAISEQKRAQARSQASAPSSQTQSATVKPASDGEATAPGSPAALEEEAGEQGAFNEETGEINWDCPCLGGMAYGPCGEQFRAAFSCFVFSKDEPKGMDCIEHFKTMQNCFREHPDVYGSELEDDEAPTEGQEGQVIPVTSEPTPAPAPASQAARAESPSSLSERTSSDVQPGPDSNPSDRPAAVEGHSERPAEEKVQMGHGPASIPEDDTLAPKAWHDARDPQKQE